MRRVAILFQAATPPPVDGAVKPPKVGGYSDSGADIAYTLRQRGVEVVAPAEHPDPAVQLDWVWPDTREGIREAIGRGASVLWANTNLFAGHPLQEFEGVVPIVGQRGETVQRVDDKLLTNRMLRSHGLPTSAAFVIAAKNAATAGDIHLGDLSESRVDELGFRFPLVIKPIRGRGSQGVRVIEDVQELRTAAQRLLDARIRESAATPLYGSRLMVEDYLPGEEVTVTVMPAGEYSFGEGRQRKSQPWALPPVRRFDHHNGVAPYNGVVPVAENSIALTDSARREPAVLEMMAACERAATLVEVRAPVRIDCRVSREGAWCIFDLNSKPNMTGPGRPGREKQESLTAIAARAIGWDYGDLLLNMLDQAWLSSRASP